MRIVVIIPTYNEAAVIGSLLEALENEFKSISGHEMHILIVDGNSTDGTAAAVTEKNKIFKNIHLLVEKEKRGLGIAYIDGMRYAIQKLNAGAVMEFDGDFQHDPKDVRRLVAELDHGYDYIIGSRYIPGGTVPKEWAWHRKLLSRYGSLFIKFMLSLPTNDNTSGFKLSRVKNFLDRMPLSENMILSKRHAYKIHFLYEMIRLGAKTKEAPISFLERGSGSSKSSLEDVTQSLKVVFILFFRKLKTKLFG